MLTAPWRRAAVVLIVVASSLSSLASATEQPSFRSSTVGVRVDVLVADGRRPVENLQATDFELRDNGITQAIELLESTEVPLNVVLALDTSASTAGSLQDSLVSAGQALIDGLVPSDRVALTTFSHAVVPRIGLASNFAAVRSALVGLPAAGRTSVFDGLYVALANTLEQPGSSLVVAFTDGSDVSSWLTPDEVVASAQRANAVVYAVTSAKVRHRSALERLADVTGGEVVEIASDDQIHATFLRILNRFRSRFVLSYTPTGVPPGGVHSIDVRVKPRGLTVKARRSYIGSPAGR